MPRSHQTVQLVPPVMNPKSNSLDHLFFLQDKEGIMSEDSEKQQAIIGIMQAFEKWGKQYHQNLFVKQSSPDYLNSFKTAVKEQGFLEKRALEPGLYMNVLESCNSNKTISKHREMLTKSCILSIVDDSFSVSDLLQSNTKTQSVDEIAPNLGYTRRQMQRFLHENYKESFFEAKSEQNSKDDRLHHFTSIFSNVKLPPDSIGMAAMSYLENQQNAVMSNDKILEKLFFNSVLRFAFPQFLLDLIKFKEECKKIFETLGKTNAKIDFLRKELSEFSPILTTFYSNLTSILAVEWFRQKSENAQVSILDSEFKIQYKKSYAVEVKNILVSATNSNKYSSFLLSHCANAFVYYKKPQDAISLFEQSRNLSNDMFEKGTLSQNIAVEYRENNNFKLMLKESREALSFYKKSGKIYHACLALKLIGEAQYQLGFKESAVNSFLEAEKLSDTIKQDKWKVLLNIGVSFNRLRDKQHRDRYLVKGLQLIPEDQTDTILGVNQMLSNYI